MPPVPHREMAPYDFWYNDPPEMVFVECLMPTGHMITIEIAQELTFEEIKEELWYVVEQRKLNLTDKSAYTFSAITNFGSKANKEEITDESKRLADVQPYFCLLQVVEKKKTTDNKLDKHITELIGKPVQDFQLLNNPEVNEFRYKIGVLTEQIANDRRQMTLAQKLTYQFPPRLADSSLPPDNVMEHVRNNEIMLVARYENDENEDNLVTFKVPMDLRPFEVLNIIFRKNAFKNKKEDTNYILKVYGRDEYIYGDYPIIQFLYVQDTLSCNGTPSFVTQPIQNVAVFKESIYQAPAAIMDEKRDFEIKLPTTHTLKKREQHISSWTITNKFQIKIIAIKGLNCDVNKDVEVAIQVGLFHGGKPLCEPQKTRKLSLQSDGNANWEQELTFDLDVVNVPRMARLCLVVYEVAKTGGGGRRKAKDSSKYVFNNPLAWVNTTVFDYKNQLKTGAMTLYTWTYAEDSQSDDLLHPLGTVESNPRQDERAAIMLSIHKCVQSLYNTFDSKCIQFYFIFQIVMALKNQSFSRTSMRSLHSHLNCAMPRN